MLLNSTQFLLFLAIVLAVYYALPGLRSRNIFLLAGSYLFCAAWDWRFIIPMLVITVLDYWAGQALVDYPQKRRRWVLWAGILVNLAMLGYFKYLNFFIDSAAGLLTTLGIPTEPAILNLLLPVGISFYTLQSIAYKLDIYWEIQQPERDLLPLALYTAYFPKLTAGPIERAHQLIPQFKARPPITIDRFESGVVLILTGMFKKVVIADVAGALIDSTAFTDPAIAPSGRVLVAMYLFALQLYGDFSGYTDIVRGVSRLFGIELMENFKQPYFAPNITDFWGRWHISLTLWLRDYIFYPTTWALLRRFGTQYSRTIMVISNMLTMLVSGLWHGASWAYVLWGLVHGVYLSTRRLLRDWRVLPIQFSSQIGNRLWFVLSVVVTFHLLALSLVIIRASSLTAAVGVFQRLLPDLISPNLRFLIGRPLALYVLLLLFDALTVRFSDDAAVRRLPVAVRSLVYVGLLYSIGIFWAGVHEQFFYFQF